MCLVSAESALANMVLEKGRTRIRALVSPGDPTGTPARVVGKIMSFSTRTSPDEKGMSDAASSKTRATVRLNDPEGLMEGDTLYVVDDRNLIVGSLVVKLIFASKSFGPMLVGGGNFKNAGNEYRVVAKITDPDAANSYIYKARGDYYAANDEEGDAIGEYKKALTADRRNPEAHLALGVIYYKQGLDEFALREFQEAYKRRNCIYDREDRFVLLKTLAEVCYRQAYESSLPQKKRLEYIVEGTRYCRESIKVYPESVKMNYYLGIFLSQNPSPSDEEARDAFLAVVKLDPDHSGANIALSNLYRKHGNLKKAKMYAQAAVKSRPGSERARLIEKSLEPEDEDSK